MNPPADSAGGILLVEGYPALAAALNAAIGKFAPQHPKRVARSLPEAEAIADATAPDILVLDFDPPHAKALAFFARLQKKLPALRVLVITANAPIDALRSRPLPSAFQFTEKPFKLADFGAALAALLGPVPPAASSAFGSLGDLNLLDVIPLQCLGGEASLVTVDADAGCRGEIHFARGQVTHAASAGSEGTDALAQMLSWTAPAFTLHPPLDDPPRSISTSWLVILAELTQSTPVPPAPSSVSPALTSAPEEAKPSKRIVMIDDTELLRIFVDEVLTTADPSILLMTAADGTEGVSRVAAALPDLVLLDYSLPDFNGDEVCRRLLANQETARIPVIMLSGHVPEMTAAASHYPNIVATLAKPFLSTALIALVAETLEQRPEVQTPAPDDGPVVDLPSPAEEAPPAVAVRQSMHRAEIGAAPDEPIIVGMRLEVVSMQLSPALQLTSVRARPSSGTLALSVRGSAAATPRAGFAMERVDLDASGQIATIRIAPAAAAPPQTPLESIISIEEFAAAPTNNNAALQVTPSEPAGMQIELLAAFQLSGVELSTSFSVAAIRLLPRDRRMRITLRPGAPHLGLTVRAAEIALDQSGKIAEILLEAVA
jgi:DNA-binding response OmpR family regulator